MSPFLARLFDMLTVNKDLSSTTPDVLQLASSLILLLLAAMFGTTLAALLTGLLLWLGFQALVTSGTNIYLSLTIVVAVAAIIVLLALVIGRKIWRDICLQLTVILYGRTPPIGHLSHITGSFVNGLLTQKLTPTKKSA